MATIPDMVKKDGTVAESELKAAGFMVVKRDIWSEDIASGLVVKTQPAAGEQYAVGATVALFVSKGPVETRVKVPSVVGLTEEKAVAMLRRTSSRLRSRRSSMRAIRAR